MNLFSFIRKAIYPFRYYLIGPIIWIIYYALYGSLQPYLIKQLIDAATPQGIDTQVGHLLILSGYFLALLVSYEFFFLFYDWCEMQYKPALKNHITLLLIDYLLEQDYYFFQSRFTGNIVAKINDVIKLVPDIIKTIIDNYLTNSASVLIGMYLLWHVHIGFALALGIWAIVFVVISLTTLHRFKYLSNNLAESISKTMGIIVDMLNNILSIKLFTAKEYELNWLTSSLQDYYEIFKKRRWFTFKLYITQSTSYQLYQGTCLFLLIYLYSQGKVTAGDFAMIITLNLWIIDCMWDMSDKMRSLSENYGSVDQALKMIYFPSRVTDAENAQPITITNGEIKFESVSFHYEGVAPLFKEISITIKPSEKVGLVGYSGSGKSTFAHLILRIYDPSSGRILIDNQDIRTVTKKSLRKAIGVNPQEPALFHRTIMENIRYGNQETTDEQVIDVATKVNANSFIDASPEGYNMIVGERGIKLSGGQRQRIALARVLLKDAPILIFDEATSQLDSETEKVIQNSLEKVMEKKTTFIIAHRLSTILHLDRILVFDQGVIIQDGTHEDLISKPGLYKTLWNNQNSGFLPTKKPNKPTIS